MRQGCCRTLTIVLADGAKLPAATALENVTLPVEWLVAFAIALPEEKRDALDTGPPPDVPGFVELVLHRSLHSHAPPSAA